MTPEERRAHCRRIASSGGRRTVERYGQAHMTELAKKGFAKAVELGYGEALARKLSGSYEAKFGKPISLSPQSVEIGRVRAEARKLYGGMACSVIGCERPGQVHHLDIRHPDPNHPSRVEIICALHHRARHRAIRRTHHERRAS